MGPNQPQIGQSWYQSTLPVHSEYEVSLEVRINVLAHYTTGTEIMSAKIIFS